ncbi:MAG: hypothetical protein ACRDKW_14300 [Actinomycetota bacterium]
MNRRGSFGKKLTTAVSLAALAAGLIVDVPKAQASADGCANLGYPAACIQVEGSGTHVDWVRGGVRLRARGSVRGHFEIWWEGGKVDTADETLSNDSFIAHTKWGQQVVLNRALPRGQICSKFWERHDNGWNDKGTACVGIG